MEVQEPSSSEIDEMAEPPIVTNRTLTFVDIIITKATNAEKGLLQEEKNSPARIVNGVKYPTTVSRVSEDRVVEKELSSGHLAQLMKADGIGSCIQAPHQADDGGALTVISLDMAKKLGCTLHELPRQEAVSGINGHISSIKYFVILKIIFEGGTNVSTGLLQNRESLCKALVMNCPAGLVLGAYDLNKWNFTSNFKEQQVFLFEGKDKISMSMSNLNKVAATVERAKDKQMSGQKYHEVLKANKMSVSFQPLVEREEREKSVTVVLKEAGYSKRNLEEIEVSGASEV